ncbi:MAG: sulfotransferase [Pseudomonadota bacterium]
MLNSDLRPILVRGMSRSGGTLLCTLLDAHPDVSFSFELYPNLLLLEQPIDQMALARSFAGTSSLKEAAALAPTPRFGTFINRLPRGGLDADDFAELLKRATKEGSRLTELKGCMRVMQLCCELKQSRDQTQRWGLKCNNAVEAYLDVFPNAQFVDIIRDGRDVLASQKNTGAFNPEVSALANSWMKTHQKFERLRKDYPDQIMIIRYEDLTMRPIETTQELCNFLNLPFVNEMLQFHEMDLTVFKTRHLSLNRITKKIDATKIGRWKTELTQEEVATFAEIASEFMKEWGYE